MNYKISGKYIRKLREHYTIEAYSEVKLFEKKKLQRTQSKFMMPISNFKDK